MPKYTVVVQQLLRGSFEVDAADSAAARRDAEEGGHGWEEPDDGWNVIEETVEVTLSVQSAARRR